MKQKNPEVIIPNKRDKTRRTRKQKLVHRAWKMGLSFLLGVAVTSTVHAIVDNQRLRNAVEKVCIIFGNDEHKCKEGVDDILEMVDNITQNNANVKGGEG